MDGVLVSSIGSVSRCWRRWCELYQVPDAETFEVPHGKRAIDIVRMLKPEFDEAQVAEGLRVIEDLEIADTEDLTVLPGVKSLLEQLPVERWAIVTSATRRLLIGRLAAAGLPVPDRLISGDMVERGKPDPEPYRRGAEMLGLAAADCIVVEDAPSAWALALQPAAACWGCWARIPSRSCMGRHGDGVDAGPRGEGRGRRAGAAVHASCVKFLILPTIRRLGVTGYPEWGMETSQTGPIVLHPRPGRLMQTAFSQ